MFGKSYQIMIMFPRELYVAYSCTRGDNHIIVYLEDLRRISVLQLEQKQPVRSRLIRW